MKKKKNCTHDCSDAIEVFYASGRFWLYVYCGSCGERWIVEGQSTDKDR